MVMYSYESFMTFFLAMYNFCACVMSDSHVLAKVQGPIRLSKTLLTFSTSTRYHKFLPEIFEIWASTAFGVTEISGLKKLMSQEEYCILRFRLQKHFYPKSLSEFKIVQKRKLYWAQIIR